MSGTETSIKQIFQKMAGEKTAIVQGIVTSENPISISLVNDNLMSIPSSLLVVPEHLTNRRINVKVTMSNISGDTENGGSGDTGENSGATKSGGGGTTGEGGAGATATTTQTIAGDSYWHSHSLEAHTHSIPDHTHDLNGHTHALEAHKHSFSFGMTSHDAVIEYDNSLKTGDYVHLLSIGDGKIYYVIDRVV